MGPTPDRFRSVEELYQAAIQLPADRRPGFLRARCHDQELRREVESLLALTPDGDPLLENSPFAKPEPVAIGAKLGPYVVTHLIGAGGMGEVYRARDTRLDREVALKVLPANAMRDRDSRSRFKREARVASQLNHPNSVTVYDIGEQDGRVFIAMEYIEGRTLDSVISQTGLALQDTLRYAIAIAAALAEAHSLRIIHRDLKPGNIMITSKGVVKVLDFGLAKISRPPDFAQTASSLETQTGMFIGTPAYMSPEQADGKFVDARSDVFSFGAMLYQMVTGKRAFHGDSIVDTMTAVVHAEPDPLPESVPIGLQKVIVRCLKKDPERRFQSMADIRVSLEELREESVSGALTPQPAAKRTGGRPRPIRRALQLAGLGVAVAALAYLGIRAFRSAPEAGDLKTVRFTITPKQLLRGGDAQLDSEVSISPDGKHIAYVESSGGQLWVRDIDAEEAHPVPGATQVYQAFWSPDNRFIGYAHGRGCGANPCELARIPIEGGSPFPIVKLNGPFRRASWSSDGETILYGEAPNGLFTVPARGGTPTLVIKHPHIEHPSFLDLPGGRKAYLYQAANEPDSPPLPHSIYVQVAGETTPHIVLKTSSVNPYPAYSPTGHIIYADGNGDSSGIWAIPFPLDTLRPGKAFPIAPHGASPTVSRTGTLVYGDLPTSKWQLKWVDRTGAKISLMGDPVQQTSPSLSPDGRKLAVTLNEGEFDLWIYDVERGTRTRSGFARGVSSFSAWNRSSDEITFTALHDRNPDLYSKRLDGEDSPRLIASSPLVDVNPDWSPDGRFLIYMTAGPKVKAEVVYREKLQDGALSNAKTFSRGDSNESYPRFSPDGHYISYVSDESGAQEVYVRDFPKGEKKWRISSAGGAFPRWNRSGKELFYKSQGKLYSVTVTLAPGLSAGQPHILFDAPALAPAYDVAPDGKRFVVMERPENEPPLSIHVVHNWFAEFGGKQTPAN